MDDKPSIPAALLRILLGLAAIASGVGGFVRHGTAVEHLDGWDVPAAGDLVYAVGVLNVALGVVLVIGLLPRLAALLLLVEVVVAFVVVWRGEGPPYAAPLVLVAFLLMVVIGSGGGRWALVDRLDPAPPRRLVRS